MRSTDIYCQLHGSEVAVRVVRPTDATHRVVSGECDECAAAGEYVARFDPDGGDPSVVYPTGTLETTPHAGRALRFATAGEAWACWQERSRRTPTRPDGKPNRPLTAFMVEIAREKKGDDDARQR